jgi:membrane protein implicated in regulation of membrane protease activity
MMSWIVWLIIAAVLGVAELLTTTLAFGLIAVAAIVAAVVGAFHLGVPLQLVAFIVAAGAGLGFVRPVAIKHVRQPPPLRTGTAALVGRSAVVTEEVTEHAGRVRIDGEEWSSRPYDDSLVIPVGTKVDVLQIKGATALVHPRE